MFCPFANFLLGQGHHRVMIYIYILVLKSHFTQSFFEIDPSVAEKKIFEGFIPYMGMVAILVM